MTATVGVNLLWLVPGVVGGSEEYTLRLLRALAEGEHDDLRVRLYGTSGLFDRHPDLPERFETATAPDTGPLKGARVGLEHSWLAARSAGDNLVHHAGGVVPGVRGAPPVVTIHDLQPLEHPTNFGHAKRRWLSLMVPRSVRAARLILTPSRYTADAIVARFDVAPDRVAVVSQGLPATEPGVADQLVDRRLRSRYGRYLLLPAIAYAHKRHADLVAVLDRLRDRHPDLSLVLTGGRGPESERVAELTEGLGLGERVHRLGRVTEAELDGLYRSSAALVFPSAYEGFGNPVLEAMARGVPAVTSDIAPLREVGGTATLTAPVGDVAALAEAVDRVLTDPQLRDRMRADGLAQAAHYRADEAAGRLADAYRTALGAWA